VVSGDGASITFASDGTFTATKFNFANAAMPMCPAPSEAGTWKIHNNSEDYPEPPANSPENPLDLWFTSETCWGGVELTTWDTGGTQGLCLELALDDPGRGVRLHQELTVRLGHEGIRCRWSFGRRLSLAGYSSSTG